MSGILRKLQTPHLLPLLQPFKFTVAATPSATLNIGSQEATISRAAAGFASIFPNDYYGRNSIIVATPGADVAQGGYAAYNSTAGQADVSAYLTNAAGTGDDGTGYAMVLGFEDDDTDRLEPYQSVRTQAVSPRLMGFKVDAAGTISSGSNQAAISLASSVYSLTFNRTFGRGSVVVVSPIAATRKAVRVTAASALGASIETYDPVGTALEDNSFYCLVMGWDTPDEQAGFRRTCRVPQLAPRMESYFIDGTGTASIDIGSEDGTLTDNGTGDYSVTFKQPFTRAPIVIVTGRTHPAQLLASATTTGFRVGCFNNGTNAAVDDKLYAIVLGYDGEEI